MLSKRITAVLSAGNKKLREKLEEAHQTIVDYGYDYLEHKSMYECRACLEEAGEQDKIPHHEDCRILRSEQWLKEHRNEKNN
jgi:Tfp pilus assembly protein PilF